MEDKKGKFLFGTRGNACFYDGNTFTDLTYNGKPFTNVGSIIQNKRIVCFQPVYIIHQMALK